MNDESIKAEIRTFLLRFFRKYELKDNEDLFSVGFVNSLFAMQLVMFLEQKFGLRIENEDLDINNFRQINTVCDFVQKKLSN
ncbi:acyl carrier protein [Ruminiclostridium cellobioparum]|jgi:methoxymalonate biosynthesis acyl carrier protein|uniref:acyl carrier protein n=1 Tax=Ruminiclostridium cellobioparum TaxID=29355 RepID=UPI0028A6FFDA|nr:acyl carrier protein [Ruminiclostridium cellobioparum]